MISLKLKYYNKTVSDMFHGYLYAGMCVGMLCISLFGQDNSVPRLPRKITRADSAVITSPPHGTVLSGQPVRITVKPRCPVFHVDLLAHYFPGKTDTVARLNEPPYTGTWDYSGLPDQDQLHLQFGYVLYHDNGDTIVSPPMPNHWIINRKTIRSRKKHICKQVAPEDTFVIDGNLDDWKSFRQVHFPPGGGFRCSWTPADFYCAIEVYDPVVTPGDRVELCLDLTRSRTLFLDIEHRIISFGPQSRSFSWAIDVSDTGVVQVDSVIVRIKEEMAWRRRLTPTGYIIEARVPFCILSTRAFPPKLFGFDISIVNEDNAGISAAGVYSWSGAAPAARHTPAAWGTIVLQQRHLLLKGVIVAGLILFTAPIVLMLFLLAYRKRKELAYEKCVHTKTTPLVQKMTAFIEDHYADTGLCPADIAQEHGCSVSDLEKLFHDELATTCSNYIQLLRIRQAKKMLAETELELADIIQKTGFSGCDAFCRIFIKLAGVSPEDWRKNRLPEPDEEDEE